VNEEERFEQVVRKLGFLTTNLALDQPYNFDTPFDGKLIEGTEFARCLAHRGDAWMLKRRRQWWVLTTGIHGFGLAFQTREQAEAGAVAINLMMGWNKEIECDPDADERDPSDDTLCV